MVCNPTSTDTRHDRRSLGYALIEFMVSMGLGALLLMVVGSFTIYVGRSFAALGNYVDLDRASRNALDTMTREIRQANRLVSYSSNQLTLEDSDSISLNYVYSPTARTLTRIKGDRVQVLLRECDYLSFAIFQRNPINGRYDYYPTAVAETCKLINMTWVCSRTIFGIRMNTESVQTAKVVMRKQ